VRGLDYYGGIVFEWVTDLLGSQATVCAGGRFDKLVEQFSGPATSAIGFALGAERLLLLMELLGKNKTNPVLPLVFMMGMSDQALERLICLGEDIRNAYPNAPVLVNSTGGSFKSQFKKADKSGARFALILGENELLQQCVSIKDLRESHEQVTIPLTEVIDFLKTH